MYPTFETSVIEFPAIEQRPSFPDITVSEVEDAVNQTADSLRLNWLKSHATSHNVCARTRLINAALVSDISDNAFRVLCFHLSYTNGTHLRTNVGNDTIAALTRCNEKTVRRSNKELEAAGWMSVKRRRRGGAEKTMTIPGPVLAQIGAEIMANLPPRLVAETAIPTAQYRTEMSVQEDLPGYNTGQDRTEMSAQGSYGKHQDRTEMSVQEDLPGYNTGQDRTEMSAQGVSGPSSEPDFGIKTGHFCPLRPDKNVRLICKENLYKKTGGESEDILHARTPEPALPPKVEKFPGYVEKVASAVLASLAGAVPAAAAPAEPPAIIQAAPEIPECWSTPKARQDAFLKQAEAKAQREVWITPDGRLEAAGGFRSELETTFPLVDVLGGLLASAVNVRSYMTAIEVMQVVRRQFVYLQSDAKAKAERSARVDALRKPLADGLTEVAPGMYRYRP